MARDRTWCTVDRRTISRVASGPPRSSSAAILARAQSACTAGEGAARARLQSSERTASYGAPATCPVRRTSRSGPCAGSSVSSGPTDAGSVSPFASGAGRNRPTTWISCPRRTRGNRFGNTSNAPWGRISLASRSTGASSARAIAAALSAIGSPVAKRSYVPATALAIAARPPSSRL